MSESMEQEVTEGNILDVVGVSRLLRVGRAEIYRLVHSGQLPVMRFGKQGRTLRFLRADILTLRKGGVS